jgi:hypothetical protein
MGVERVCLLLLLFLLRLLLQAYSAARAAL